MNAPEDTSSFKLAATRASMRVLYESDSRPWVIAYSGGKDSTTVLQLVYELLVEEKAQGRNGKSVYVISSDTGVEAPNVAAYVASTLSRVREASLRDNVPLTARLVKPAADEEFWSKLIGLGYPSPTRWFRWCTTNMKIKPSRRAIEEITRQHGSVILLLGTRSDESVSRGNAIAGRETNVLGLNRHHEIPNALVAAPIVDWANDDVWNFLYSNNPPWGGDHGFMLSLYRQANGGECPVVLDLAHHPAAAAVSAAGPVRWSRKTGQCRGSSSPAKILFNRSPNSAIGLSRSARSQDGGACCGGMGNPPAPVLSILPPALRFSSAFWLWKTGLVPHWFRVKVSLSFSRHGDGNSITVTQHAHWLGDSVGR